MRKFIATAIAYILVFSIVQWISNAWVALGICLIAGTIQALRALSRSRSAYLRYRSEEW